MKAVVYTKYGSPADLKLTDVPKPVAGKGEVLIRVRAASINSWDWDLLQGKPWLARIGGFFKPQHPILGADVSGIVAACGPETKDFQPGDAVFGDLSPAKWGGFAEYVCGPEKLLTKIPDGLSFEDAAAIPQAATLALQGLQYNGPFKPGQEVLINGAGGGVGSFAIPLAKHFGAKVTAVDLAEKRESMLALGADRVIDYKATDFTKEGQTYDLIVDVMATKSVADYSRSLNPGGAMAMVGGKPNRIFQTLFMGPWHSLKSNKKIGLVMHKPNRPDLEELKLFYQTGVIHPLIDQIFPLENTPAAFEYFGTQKVKGKLVISLQ
ncbi:MAG: NAD(P)-dependent alcohol dehydrogenase [Bacteroidetes bacterium]|nr:NAD(P)-dependent alcohol dehydrogenase [Bacteroidota bacterium]